MSVDINIYTHGYAFGRCFHPKQLATEDITMQSISKLIRRKSTVRHDYVKTVSAQPGEPRITGQEIISEELHRSSSQQLSRLALLLRRLSSFTVMIRARELTEVTRKKTIAVYQSGLESS